MRMDRKGIKMGGQEIRTALGRNIKLLRANRNFSQALLAEKADISIAYLSKIERGIKYPKPDILSQIAEGLNVEVYELFKTNLEPKPAIIIVNDDKKKLLNRLSKAMTIKVNIAVNNAIERVFKVNHHTLSHICKIFPVL
jgi:transcriptional regulator with XRE-family HTH domain